MKAWLFLPIIIITTSLGSPSPTICFPTAEDMGEMVISARPALMLSGLSNFNEYSGIEGSGDSKPNHRATNLGSFGRVLSLNANGQTLLVGHSAEGSSASGIDGNWDIEDSSAAESGAVFLY